MANAKEIIEKYESEEDREKVSLYLSKSIYEKFKKTCRTAPASKIMEHLMKLFIESAKNGKDLDV